MLWVVLIAMTALAIGLVVAPFVRRPAEAPSRASYDLEIYRDQLQEVDRELAEGLLSAQQAEAARGEIGRRALAAAGTDSPSKTASSSEPSSASSSFGRWMAPAAGVAVSLAMAAIYLSVGSPFLPGAPAADRPHPTAQDPAVLVERLARRMEQNPDDPRGWALLGRTYASMRRFDKAAVAYGKAATLRSGDADLLSRYGEALTFAGEGVVNPAARRAFEAALRIDTKEPRARYYAGLADLQAGRRREALVRWRTLLKDSPADAPWMVFLAPRIEKLAAELGETPSRPKTAAAEPPRGPSRDDVRAAQSMSPEDRQAMIRSMVDGLAARLKENPDDFAGWMRLGRARGVLGETKKSRDAYGRAAALKPGDRGALAAYAGALAEAAGSDLTAEPKLEGVLKQLLKADPDSRVGLWLSGARALMTGDVGAARGHWTRLHGLLPAESPQRAELGARLDRLKAGASK